MPLIPLNESHSPTEFLAVAPRCATRNNINKSISMDYRTGRTNAERFPFSEIKALKSTAMAALTFKFLIYEVNQALTELDPTQNLLYTSFEMALFL